MVLHKSFIKKLEQFATTVIVIGMLVVIEVIAVVVGLPLLLGFLVVGAVLALWVTIRDFWGVRLCRPEGNRRA